MQPRSFLALRKAGDTLNIQALGLAISFRVVLQEKKGQQIKINE